MTLEKKYIQNTNLINKNFKKILVIKHGSLGDLVFAFDAMNSIRSHFKKSKITLLTQSHFKNLLSKSGYFDSIITDNRGGFLETISVIKKIYFNNFDLIIDLQNSKRTNFYNFIFKSFSSSIINGNQSSSHIRYKIHKKGEETPRDGLLRQIKMLNINLKKNDFNWLKCKINFDIGKNLILLIPSVSKSGLKKQWPVNKFQELAKKLENKGYKICVVGNEADNFVTKSVISYCKNAIDLTGTSPPEIIYSVAQKSKIIISNDTGPGHVASLSNKNIIWIALNNLTSKVNLGDSLYGSTILSKNLNDITVNTVLNKISELENNL